MASISVRLVLLETSGNQRFIFDTNKIREVIGASEMVYQAGTRLVFEAVAKIGAIAFVDEDWKTPDGLRRFLLDPTRNPPIEKQEDPDKAVEIIVATSGKALLLVQDETVGKKIVEHVTRAALIKLPGLTMRGVVGKAFTLRTNDATKDDARAFDQEIKAVHKALAALGADVPGAETRFPRLPFIAPCETSGQPAAQVRIWIKEDGTVSSEPPTRLSAVSSIKGGYFEKRNRLKKVKDKNPRGYPDKGWCRIQQSLPEEKRDYLVETVKDLEIRISGRSEQKDQDGEDGKEKKLPGDGLDWLSVIHADGNGLGQIFLNFGSILTETLEKNTNERPDKKNAIWLHYITFMRNFSLALDICTVNAFATALEETVHFDKENKPSVVVPVILGGDDLTVLCDGRIAIKFAKVFLDEFERQTKRKDLCPLVSQKEENPADKTAQTDVQDIIPKIAKQTHALAVPRLSACAGVAIVKGHFPFHQAYHLAEALLKSAKATKTWTDPAGQLSALDYHVLYDASGADLKRIRERLTLPDKSRLFARPYIVTPLDDAIAALGGEGVRQMVERRHWQALENAILTLSVMADEEASGDPERKERLSRTLQHDLRSALFEGQNATEARLNLIQGRISKSAFKSLLIGGHVFGDLPEFQGGASKPVSDDSSVVYATRLLDAMDIVEFWQGA